MPPPQTGVRSLIQQLIGGQTVTVGVEAHSAWLTTVGFNGFGASKSADQNLMEKPVVLEVNRGNLLVAEA